MKEGRSEILANYVFEGYTPGYWSPQSRWRFLPPVPMTSRESSGDSDVSACVLRQTLSTAALVILSRAASRLGYLGGGDGGKDRKKMTRTTRRSTGNLMMVMVVG